MNNFTAIGRLTGEVKFKVFESGKNLSEVGIAIKKDYKNKQGEYDADLFDMKIWGKPAEFAGNYLKKGNKVAIVGRMENNNYEKDGQKVYRNVITVNSIESLQEKPKDAESADTEAGEERETSF